MATLRQRLLDFVAAVGADVKTLTGAIKLHSLPRSVVAGPGTLAAGVTSVLSAAGAYTAPAPTAALTDPPQRFAVRNDGTSNLTLQVPDGVTGNLLNLTLYPGMARVYRQISATGYGLEDGIPFSVLRSQFAPAATPITVSLAQDLTVPVSSTVDVLTMDLGVGTWFINGQFNGTMPNSVMLGTVVLGTAAGTIAGPSAASTRNGGTQYPTILPLTGVVVVVTTAGNVVFRFTNSNTTATPTLTAQRTAFTAIKVAP